MVGIDMKKMAIEFYAFQNTPYKKLYLRKAPTKMHFWCYNNIALILNVLKIWIV